jgi:hypothetical protein
MELGSVVLCIKGDGVCLKENETYTVAEVTIKGNLLLFEVDPPEGYTSFLRERFEDTGVFMEEFFTELEEISY